MQNSFIIKLQSIPKNWHFWLFIITGIAIIIRSLPAWTNAAWGCDFGIYYGLTQSFVNTGDIFNSYSGWGLSYQYFPMLYLITGGAHYITGIDIVVLLPKIAPIFGGLSIFIFYFVVKELLHSKKIALLSSLFLAVLPFHVYQTSQAAPLTIGHFFLMLSLYFFIKTRKNNKFIIPLLLSTSFLIMTHHLTTYIYLISIVCIIFIENISKKEWTESYKKDYLYITIASILTFSYWIIIATPVFDSFMKGGLKIGSIYINQYITIISFYLMLFLSIVIIKTRRKFDIFWDTKRQKLPSSYLFIFTISISILAFIIFTNFDFRWAKIYLTPESFLLFLPFLIALGFGSIGARKILSMKNGSITGGWFLAIGLSLIYGFISQNKIILPHRHLEYIMAPLSIMVIYGIIEVTKFDYKNISITRFRKIHLKKHQIIFPLLILILVTTNAASVYPSYLALEKLDTSYETITDGNFAAINWINENLDRNTTLVASDHRLSLLANAYGFNTTRDRARFIWNTSELDKYSFELYGKKQYDKITHVIVDDVMKYNVVHIGFNGTKIHMTNDTWTAAYDKFLNQPFELVYRNESLNINRVRNESAHWTEIYKVNWTYLEKYK